MNNAQLKELLLQALETELGRDSPSRALAERGITRHVVQQLVESLVMLSTALDDDARPELETEAA